MAAFSLFSNWLDNSKEMLLNRNILVAIASTKHSTRRSLLQKYNPPNKREAAKMAAFALFSNWLDTTTEMLLNRIILVAIASTKHSTRRSLLQKYNPPN